LRYFVRFSYKGTHYRGWQSQPNAVTVQGTMEHAFSLLMGEPIALTGAGRTDSGVHAAEMFAHFDIEKLEELGKWIHKLNSFLPNDIAIHRIYPVKADAHARFDATKRTYEYRIATQKDVFSTEFAWRHTLPLDLEAMNEAAAILKEYDDFECFSKVDTDVATFLCKIREAYWEKRGHELVFRISADRFLRNMVRAIVGTLVTIGSGKLEPNDIRDIIESRDRGRAGFSVPAHGLSLVKVDYDYI